MSALTGKTGKETPAEAETDERPRGLGSYATADDGTRIYFEVFTRGRGSAGDEQPRRAFPVVLVMGLGTNGRLWAPAVRRLLASGYDVIAVDHRGSGRSDTPWRPWTTRTMAADMRAVMDALEIERAHLAGASLGGMIVQELALELSERVASLVLLSTTGGVPRRELRRLDLLPRSGLIQILEAAARSWRPASDPDRQIRDFLRMASSADFAAECRPEDEAWTAVAAMVEDPTSHRGFVMQLAAALGHSTWSRLHRLTMPVEVHHGTEDRLVPFAAGRELARRISGARLVVHEGAGHGVIEHLDEVGERWLEFLDCAEAAAGVASSASA